MSALSITLFGRFSVQRGGKVVDTIESGKVQDMFCHLLLNRRRPRARDALATMLWGDSPTAQAKKYLRQALWQLQSALDLGDAPAGDPVLLVDAEWVHINPAADLWLDVAIFEQAVAAAQGIAGAELDGDRARSLDEAVRLYQGDLLEGCYHDWCLYERERLQSLYLVTREKLMSFCEAHRRYEEGQAHGESLLRHDRAHEGAHRRLMRLHYLAGDRTAALRQYDRCVAALADELGVAPAKGTTELYHQMRADQFDGPALMAREARRPAVNPASSSPELLPYLKHFLSMLTDFRKQVEDDVRALERSIHDRR